MVGRNPNCAPYFFICNLQVANKQYYTNLNPGNYDI